ncbi:MAG TPA: isoamylase early set domain-containing protein [Candidatus Baltobacteraceae bacterium]|nr:isoamylase early set domain-containing protein [Candidatus Baltobacteraceae bacterium]
MIEKRPRGAGSVEVTFRMPPLDGAVELYLCGDFNDWHTSGMPMKQEPDGSWACRIILESGKSYRFRYYDNQGRWHNDWDADAYVPNVFGTEDSVVDLAAPVKNVGADPQDASVRGRSFRGPGKNQRGRNPGGLSSASRRHGAHHRPDSPDSGSAPRGGGRNPNRGNSTGTGGHGRGRRPRRKP